MESLPSWLADAVNAAGICGVYNAEEWDRFIASEEARPPVVFTELPPLPH